MWKGGKFNIQYQINSLQSDLTFSTICIRRRIILKIISKIIMVTVHFPSQMFTDVYIYTEKVQTLITIFIINCYFICSNVSVKSLGC